MEGRTGRAWSVNKGAVTQVRPQSDQLFYVYTGVKGGLLGSPMPFLNATRLLERNVAFFTDPHGASYERGISKELDSFATFLEWQQSFHQSLPHVRRLFCLGTSMGGYAALLYGYLLRAEQVWAFSPAVEATDFSDQAIVCEHPRLVDLLRSSNGTTQYHVYYHRGSEMDERAAALIAGCDGVHLLPQDGEGHNVVSSLLEQGRLSGLLVEP